MYAVTQKREKSVMLLHHFVISWLEEKDLIVWIHYRYSIGVKKFYPDTDTYHMSMGLMDEFIRLSTTSMESQVILGKLKKISVYA